MVLKITEKEFMLQVRDLAKIFNWRWYHPFLSTWSERGYPDATLVRPPRLIFVEFKVGKNTLSDAQKEWQALLTECEGCEYYVWYPEDIETIAEVLK